MIRWYYIQINFKWKMKLIPCKKCVEEHYLNKKFKIYIKNCNPYITCLILYKTSYTFISNWLIQRYCTVPSDDCSPCYRYIGIFSFPVGQQNIYSLRSFSRASRIFYMDLRPTKTLRYGTVRYGTVHDFPCLQYVHYLTSSHKICPGRRPLP